VTFADGSTIHADLLVCADGVGSMARARLQPRSRSSYAGYVAWRGTVPEMALDPATRTRLGDAITYYVYANSHILAYPIPNQAGSVEPGHRLINFVWYRNYLAGDDLDDLMTDLQGVHRPISLPPGAARDHHVRELRAVAAARLPAVLAEVVEATEQPFVQVIHDVEVERMVFGPVCLLGDAAFVVRPHAAAGTAKACDDGWQLAAALDAHPDLDTALAAWEASQLDLGRRLLERTRSVGRQSQIDNSWKPGDPDHFFGLHHPGEA
jgi:2,6-dihydroxypyridine 3-monooxygenase